MTELALTLAVGVLLLLFAAYTGRSLLAAKGLASSVAARSPASAAARSLLHVHARAVAIVALLVAVLLWVGFGLVRPHGSSDPASSFALAAWLSGSFALGAAVLVGSVLLAGAITGASASRIRSWARLAPGTGPLACLRFGATSVLCACAVSLMLLAALLALCWRILPAAAVHHAALLVVAFGLGSALGALVIQSLAGTYLGASRLACRDAHEVLDVDDIGSPHAGSSLALAVSRSLAPAAIRTSDLMASMHTALVVAVVCVASFVASNGARLSGHRGILLLPLLTLCFGAIATAVAVAAARTDAKEPFTRVMERGFVVSLVLTLASLAGLTRWLLDALWRAPFLCASLGALSAGLCVVVTGYWTSPDGRFAKAMRQSGEAGAAPAIVRGLAYALHRAVLLALLLSLTLAAGYWIGGRTGMPDGGLLGMSCALLGMLALGPYVLACSMAAGTAVAAASCAQAPDESVASVLMQTAHRVQPVTRAYQALAAGAVAAVSLGAMTRVASAYGSSRTLQGPFAWWPAVLGAVVGTLLVLWFSSRGLSAIAAGSAHVRPLVTAQQQAAREPSASRSDVAERQAFLRSLLQESLRQGLPLALGALGLTLLVVLVVRAIGAQQGASVALTAVFSLCAASTLVALGWGLTFDGAAASWSTTAAPVATQTANTAVDGTQNWANNLGTSAAVVSETLSDPFHSVAGPSLYALAKLLAAAVVTLAPLFF